MVSNKAGSFLKDIKEDAGSGAGSPNSVRGCVLTFTQHHSEFFFY